MNDICFCPSCDGGQLPLLREITLLGQPLTIRNVRCSCDGVHYEPRPTPAQLQLSILLTEYCPAQCPFCIAGDHSGHRRIDLRQMEKALRALRAENVLNYIAITGGEPMTEPALLNETLCLIYEVFGTDLMVGVNTCGVNLDKLHKLSHLYTLDRYRISRHHWDDARNQALFGIRVPPAAELQEVITGAKARDLFALNCLLLRDWVGTPEAVHRHLEFVADMGAPLAAFISPTPVNAFTRRQQVDFRQVLRRDDPRLLFTKGYFEQDTCRCMDGVAMVSDGRVVEFYGRSNNQGGQPYVRGLVYGADNVLRAGFGGQILMKPEGTVGG